MSSANLLGSAGLVMLSFLANGQLNRMADRRAAKIRFVEAQLKALYGPLYAITESNQAIYQTFRHSNERMIDIVVKREQLTESEEVDRDVWNKAVFQPSNRRMRQIIEENANLFTTETMPQAVVDFLAHVENWEAILASGSASGNATIDELVPFPTEFPEYVRSEYQRVSKQHARLVGRQRRVAK